MSSDVAVVNHMSLIGLTIITPAAQAWAAEHLPDDAQWLGQTVFVEPRYADAVIDGMMADGLSLA